jgi:uncharacterized RDD family membrane protein YckC
MTEAPGDFAATAPDAVIAGFWRRLAALWIDALVLSVPATLAGLAAFRWASSLGQAGRLIGFGVALLYFGLLNSSLGGGRTIGKRLFGIRVIDRAGGALSPMRSGLRFLIIALPIFLNGLWFDVTPDELKWPIYLAGTVLALVIFGGGGAIVYLFVFNRRTRLSLHDLAVGSFVVRDPPGRVSAAISTPRVHLIVASLWFSAVLIGTVIFTWIANRPENIESMKPVAELQRAIRAQFGLQQVKVTLSTTSKSSGGQNSTTSWLQIVAKADVSQDGLGPLVSDIAAAVLDRDPDLLGRNILTVHVWRGFDLGITNWSDSYNESHDAAAWREKLKTGQ